MADDIPADRPPSPIPLEYRTPRARVSGPSVGSVIGKLMLIVGVPALLISVLLPSMGRVREPAKRALCAVKLKSIGQSMLAYANDHGGSFPDSIEAMILTRDLDTFVLVPLQA